MDGSNIFILNEILKLKPVIYIANERESAEEVKKNLSSFKSKFKSYFIPAWDIMPYDSSSPGKEIQSKRINTIDSLLKKSNSLGHNLIITTVNSIIQKIPYKNYLLNSNYSLSINQNLDIEKFKIFLTNSGYARISTVREKGEYSIRGGIIDIFPSNNKNPIRVDMFGDCIESIKEFDPLTQISISKINNIEILPSSEIPIYCLLESAY